MGPVSAERRRAGRARGVATARRAPRTATRHSADLGVQLNWTVQTTQSKLASRVASGATVCYRSLRCSKQYAYACHYVLLNRMVKCLSVRQAQVVCGPEVLVIVRL